MSSGGSACAAWHAEFSLLIQPHTGCRAPPGSGLLAWSWLPWQQGQHSTCPPVGWGDGGGLPSKSRAGDLSVRATEKERGETWSLNSGALGCPFRPGCKTPKCEPSFSQPSAGISPISSVLRGSSRIFLLQKNPGPEDQPHSESALTCLLLPLLPPPSPPPPSPPLPPAPMLGPGLTCWPSGFSVGLPSHSAG